MDEFRIEDLLDENLIFMNEEAPDYETLLHNLSDKLEEKLLCVLSVPLQRIQKMFC